MSYFDTLAFAETLEGAGLDPKLSRAVSCAMRDIAMKDIATKADIEASEHRLTVRGIAGLVAAVAFLSALITLF
jgi:hypothetical protein